MSASKGMLDDAAKNFRLDASGMVGALADSSKMLLDPLLESAVFKINRRPRLGNLVFAGMGGSAITADVVLDWMGDRLKIPFSVVREEKIPGFVDNRTLFVALSYSGETFETLSAFERARRKKSVIVGLGSGGQLMKLCQGYGYPFYRIRPSVAPRAALYRMVAACSIILEAYGLAGRLPVELNEASRELASINRRVGLDVVMRRNPAKRLAYQLFGKVPAVYALARMGSVARRFKGQVNENCKSQARYELLPEAGHNDVEAWQRNSPRETRNLFFPLLLRDYEETTWESRILDAFKKTIASQTLTTPVEVRSSARSRLGRLLGPILFLDYVSVYLAFLRRLDPSVTNRIKEYRASVRA